MIYKDLADHLPVPYHPTWDVLDATKIQAFMDSPRRFFFEYVLGWRGTEPNIHLVFGSAWHDAMEFLMNNVGKYDVRKPEATDILVEAFRRFSETYRMEYPDPFGDLANGPKTPDGAMKALLDYAARYSGDAFDTKYTEIAGTVPISMERLVHFKMDSIIEDERGIWSMEHKTSGNEFDWNSAKWSDKWSVMPQIWVYSHALRAIYRDRVQGVIVNGTLISKRRTDFKRVPVQKTNAMMQAGLEHINHIVDQIDWNFTQLQNDTPTKDTMFSFPCNGVSCSKYGCPYMAFCGSYPNPLRLAEHGRVPAGLQVDFWDPRRNEEKAKVVMHLEEKA